MARTADSPRPNRRREPRYPTRHRVEGASLDGRLETQGVLRDLSAGGCGLHLDRHIPPGTKIEAVCGSVNLIWPLCDGPRWPHPLSCLVPS